MTKWLLLLYRMPREPTGPRMALWRALKRIEGGEYLQDGVFVVKHTKLNEVTLEDLAHDIRNANGEANLATGSIGDEKHLLARMRAFAQNEPAAPVTTRKRPGRRRDHGHA